MTVLVAESGEGVAGLLDGVFLEVAHSPEDLVHVVQCRLPALLQQHPVGLIGLLLASPLASSSHRLAAPHLRTPRLRTHLLPPATLPCSNRKHSVVDRWEW